MGHRSRQRRLLLGITGLLVVLLLGQTVVSSSRWLNRSFAGFFVHENLTVGPYSLPGWSGDAAGLKSLDRIVGIDGRSIRERGELYEQARKLPPETPVRYRISRGDQQLDIVVPTRLFLLSDWLLSFGIYVLIGLAFLVIGVLPSIYRASSPVALPLCFMVTAVFIWFETTFDFMTEGRLAKEIRIFALGLTPSAAIHLALLLRQASTNTAPRRLTVGALYGTGVVIAALNSVSYFGPVEVWRQFYRLAYGYVFLGALSFLAITADALKRTDSDLERSRLRVMLVGALAGFLIPAFTTVLTSSLQLSIPYNLALLPTVFFPISVAYALLKYRLFDLGHALKFALSRVALLAVMILLYALVAVAVAPLAGESVRDPLVMTFFSLLIVMLFNPLLRRFESVIDRFIYGQDYDPAALQSQVSLFLRSLDSAPVLAKGFLERIVKPLGIETASVIYRQKAAPDWLSFTSGGQAPLDNVDTLSLSRLWADKGYDAICRAEVPLDPRFEGRRAEILQACARWQAEIMLPLVYENELRGMISVGVKRAGREYSANDFHLLSTLAEQ
ncbi:MAG: hypothetical protein FJ143_04910, partial [Deltaproteobacteria bacterium]|nr:hypothetical protein [Deltaproteobacteria bacterium]